MTMIHLEVRKIGSSLGVVLPNKVMCALRTAEGETLYLTETPGGGYRLTPSHPDSTSSGRRRHRSRTGVPLREPLRVTPV